MSKSIKLLVEIIVETLTIQAQTTQQQVYLVWKVDQHLLQTGVYTLNQRTSSVRFDHKFTYEADMQVDIETGNL